MPRGYLRDDYKLLAFTKNLEKTFIAIKPDGVQRGLIGQIISRFESKGFKLVALKMLTPSQELAERHYGVHSERPFFPALVKFITSGPIIAMVWEGKNVISGSRNIIGATNPIEALPGSIRGEYAVDIGRNIIHGSDGQETSDFEISLWFSEDEINKWDNVDNLWRYE